MQPSRFQEWFSKSNRLAPDEDLEEDDALEEEFEEKLAVQRSFQSCEDPAAMRRAADYSDEWFRTTKGGFRVYYFCAAGGAVYPCLTLTLSDMWDRLHAAMDATSQRWYCPACKTRYKTKYGVLCEMFGSDPSIAYYAKAEFPPDSLRDVKFMAMRSGSSNQSLQRSSLPRCPGSALELLDLSSRLQAPWDPSASRRTRGRRFPRLSGCSSTTSRNHAELTPNKRGPSSSSRGSSVSTVSARPASSLQATATLLKQSNL